MMPTTTNAIKELMNIQLNLFHELINYNPDKGMEEIKEFMKELELIKLQLIDLLIKAENEKEELDSICF